MTGDLALEVDDLVVDYGTGRKRSRAIDHVGFSIARGETLGLVGESGSGKTTIGMAALGLVPVTSGSIRILGDDATARSGAARRRLATLRQVVFQNPYSSLDPTKTIGYTLAEPARAAGIPSAESDRRMTELLNRVGLSPDAVRRYPAQFSGGQRQRIAIARALMVEPALVICDEPVSSLDLSVQAEVMNLLAQLQRELGLSMLFISHDLSVVRHISRRVMVLQHGRIVEEGDAGQVYLHPREVYTQRLIAAAPIPDPVRQRARREARL